MFEFIFGSVILTTLAITVTTCLCIGATGLFIAAVYYFIARSNKAKTDALLETGQRGEATILSLEDTGVRINDDPRVRMTLEVRIEGYPPYQVTKSTTVPMIRLSQVQVGSIVAVLADPSDPANPDKLGLLLR